MSAGQRPRTPAHFPRMKVRGKRRRHRAWERALAVDERVQSAIVQVLDIITDAFGIPRIDNHAICAALAPDAQMAKNNSGTEEATNGA
ncbi:hypothetical protein [Rhodococcoides fascians]|uniref:hypothetical protein n=1 Tax=Rhodococcoides fascians TaxID=1828 RepID=UPI00278508EF|nr:hypothetical protein [Rhodococcus fascians]MDQ0283780.1 hypothetical protein [Rhodococcus fascians]